MADHRMESLRLTTPSLILLGAAIGGVHATIRGLLEGFERWMPEWMYQVVALVDALGASAAVVVYAWLIVRTSQERQAPDMQRIRTWLRWCTVGTIGVLLLMQVPAGPGFWHGTVLTIEGGAILAFLGWMMHGMLNVFFSYRTARTPILLRVVGFALAAVLVLAWGERIVGIESLEAAKVFSIVLLIVLTLLLARRRRWLRLLSRTERWGLAGWAAALAISGTVAAANLFDGQSQQARAVAQWMAESSAVAGSLLLMVAAFAVVVLVTVVSGESSAERKEFEFDAITFLNRVAAQHDQSEQLYETVVTLALGLSEATSAWLLLRSESSTWTIAAIAGTDRERAEALHIPEVLGDALADDAIVIPWLREDERFFRIARSAESYAQSLLVVPLRDSEVSYGAIVLASGRPFAFERGDAELLEAFAPAVSVALANQRLMQQAIERERLQRELMMGREIQQKLLPVNIPTLNGWEVVGWSEPAYEVGGDYYDFFWLAGGTACVLVADVSGKGISAAFYMAKLKGVCIALAPLCSDVREFVLRIHRAFDGVLEPRVYISLIAVGIAPDGTLHVVRAGHPPPLVARKGGRIEIQSSPGLAIGLVRTERFAAITEELSLDSSSSMVVLYTDGVIEAGLNSRGELGISGFAEHVARAAMLPSARAAAVYLQSVLRQYVGDVLLHDDMTMVVLRCSTPSKATNGTGI
jgi:sigma-B regulation protein RsbU (phosphoserine phosphatase)